VQPEIDWLDWLQRWDAQQEGYVPEREARFTAMFDALAELLPASFVALDLACGPGSISQRLLARFPGARDRGGHRSGDAGHRTGCARHG
jgi:trans-aconitate methyltransferase